MNLKTNDILAFLAIVILLMNYISIISIQQIYSQPTFDVEITHIIEPLGGNLKTIIILTPTAGGTVKLDINFPIEFISKESIFHVTYLDQNLSFEKINNNNTATLKLEEISISSGQPIKIIIYQPNYIKEDRNRNYVGKFLTAITLNYPIGSMKLNIKLPPDTRALNLPEGYSQYQIIH